MQPPPNPPMTFKVDACLRDQILANGQILYSEDTNQQLVLRFCASDEWEVLLVDGVGRWLLRAQAKVVEHAYLEVLRLSAVKLGNRMA